MSYQTPFRSFCINYSLFLMVKDSAVYLNRDKNRLHDRNSDRVRIYYLGNCIFYLRIYCLRNNNGSCHHWRCGNIAWRCDCIKNTNAVGCNACDPGGEPHAIMPSVMMVMPPVMPAMRRTSKRYCGAETHYDNEKLFHKTSCDKKIYFLACFFVRISEAQQLINMLMSATPHESATKPLQKFSCIPNAEPDSNAS